jgi:hypothetical protein
MRGGNSEGNAGQRLISYFEQTLGKPLTTVLLSGYGEEQCPDSYAYRIETVNPSTESKSIHRLALASDSAGLMPVRDEPLVLLSILKLCLELGEDSSFARPDLFEIFKCLGWEESAQTYRLIQQAMRKYYLITIQTSSLTEFQGTDKKVVETEEIRIINSLWMSDEERAGEALASLEVMFNEDFIQGVREKRLVSIEWANVISVRTLEE